MSVCDGAEGADGADGGFGVEVVMRVVMRVVAVSDVSSDLSSPACQNSREFGNKLRHYRLICDRAPLVQLIIFPAGNVD